MQGLETADLNLKPVREIAFATTASEGLGAGLCPFPDGKLRNEQHLCRALVPREPRATVVDERILVEGLPRSQHHVGAHRFAGVRMLDADDCRLRDCGVLENRFFHFCGVHVEARHDDEVFRAVDQVQETVLVDNRDVTSS